MLKENIFEDIKIRDGLSIYTNEIDRIFKRYQLKKGDYEYSVITTDFFEAIGWNNQSYRDIITPFWRLFTAALAFYSSEHEFKRGAWKDTEVDPTYILDNDNFLRYRTYYDKIGLTNGTSIGKEKIGIRYHEKNETHYENIICTFAFFEELKKLAALSDSIANFSPCPEKPFNSVKGLLPDVGRRITIGCNSKLNSRPTPIRPRGLASNCTLLSA